MTRPHLAALAAGVVAILAACGVEGGSSSGGGSAGPLPPGLEPIPAGARLQPPAVTDRCYSPPVREVFHGKQQWDEYWYDATRKCPPPPIPAGVDFAKEMLVYASMGRRMSDQDRMTIDGSGIRNDTLLIFVRRSMLAAGCPGRERTFPQSLVKLPASDKPVRFVEEHRKIPCGG